MTRLLPPQRPKAPSRPDLLLDQQPERGAVRHPGVDGVQAVLPPHRQTSPGFPAPAAPGSQPPPAPRLPGELAPTLPVPNPLQRLTIRRPTPPSSAALARRSDPPAAQEARQQASAGADDPEPITAVETPMARRTQSPLPAPSVRPEDARNEALSRENERLRRERDQARKALETTPPTSASGETLSDEALGKLVKSAVDTMLKRVGAPTALIAMLGVGGGALYKAGEGPAPVPVTIEQIDEKLKPITLKLDRQTTTLNEVVYLQRCQRKKIGQIGGSLLPATDRMGSALKPQPFEDDCPESPRPLVEPKAQ